MSENLLSYTSFTPAVALCDPLWSDWSESIRYEAVVCCSRGRTVHRLSVGIAGSLEGARKVAEGEAGLLRRAAERFGGR